MACRTAGNESSPQGPMSFAVQPDESIVLLDQVNFRVATFGANGTLESEIPLPADTFQDLTVWPDGTVLALDRLVLRSLVALQPGRPATPLLAVEGEGTPEGGAITALLTSPDGVYFEYLHSLSVRVLGNDLRPLPETLPCPEGPPLPLPSPKETPSPTCSVLQGRPGATPGSSMSATLTPSGVEIALRPGPNTLPVTAVLPTPEGLLPRIAALEADALGRVYLAVHYMEFLPDEPTFPVAEWVEGTVFDPDLRVVATFLSPYTISEWEQFREFVVSGDGAIYQMSFHDGGVRITRWSWRIP